LLCPAPGMEIFKVLFDGFEKNFGMWQVVTHFGSLMVSWFFLELKFDCEDRKLLRNYFKNYQELSFSLKSNKKLPISSHRFNFFNKFLIHFLHCIINATKTACFHSISLIVNFCFNFSIRRFLH
jgi:hypothetical protein